jgi:Eco57I restriction-modification methylase
MIAGVRGRLITASFADTELPAIAGNSVVPPDTTRALEEWSARRDAAFGPASSVRAIADGIALPLLKILGFTAGRRVDGSDCARLEALWRGTPLVPVTVTGWDQPLDAAWRESIREAVRADERWSLIVNGTHLRIVDAHRTWSRHYLEFDLALLAHDRDAFALLWWIGRAESLGRSPRLLDVAVDLSARHGAAICGALAGGVLDSLGQLLGALARRRRQAASPTLLLEQSLTVLYRVLFLLFAEARGLVPVWHPVYRDRYTIDSIVSTLLTGRRYRGVWAAINAISRLAHAGCSAGELKVTAFNGRLFSPSGTGAFDREAIEDEVMAKALLSISTTSPTRGAGRRRIVYRDLDVEELGAVYEQVLDYEPDAGQLTRTRDLRKSTGAFYTPRSLTAYLVRDTLQPLLVDKTAEQMLKLRILDPAMGSGAFLVAACTQLAEAVEEALIRDGQWHRSDVTGADRIALRREVAQRCLFGVDLNPTAVQVARLSLWLTTLAADKPLTFLDHRLIAGNSLVGASPADVWRQPGGGRARGKAHRETGLFDLTDFAPVLRHAVQTRLQLASESDESAAIVRAKERTLAALHSAASPLGRHTRVLDLWCAGWFWPDGRPPDRGTFAELMDVLLDRRRALSLRVTTPLLDAAQAAAAEHRFLHWSLAFPEVFNDADGQPLGEPGFDAIVGNPPWDMVRGDSGDSTARESRRDAAKCLTNFVREAGIYRVDTRSHVNRYQLFVERALQLVRRGGRIGFILPMGTITDGGCAPLRRHLFDHAAVDSVVGFDNRQGIFPIHRSVRFVLMSATNGRPTESVQCRFGLGNPEDLDQLRPRGDQIFRISRAFVSRLSGDDDLAIPEIRDVADLRILEQISARFPMLQSPTGWNVAFSRELNATDDRGLFVPFDRDGRGRPVLEGKQIEPFRVSVEGCRYQLREHARVRIARRPRLAYRDIASATNRVTLIAAIVPADAVTTHTLFCLKTPLPLDAQHVLCALLNSFVANYLIRFRVNTHVTVSLVSRLRVPSLDRSTRTYQRLSILAQTLMHSPDAAEQQPEYAELQGLVGKLYGLSEDDFVHVLSTFPLIPDNVKSDVLIQFNNVH